MPVCDLQESWTQFLQFAKTKCSPAAFGNWLAPIRVLPSDGDRIHLEIPNIFVQEYLLTNYRKELTAFLPVDHQGEPAIYFVVAPPQKKNSSAPINVNTLPNKEHNSFPELKLNGNYRFETFIEGPSNQFVKSAAIGVASRPGQVYNPLFIHGGVGLGKTHILHSIGHYVKEHHKKLKIQCITTEAFINDLVDHLRNKSVDKMKRFYRNEVDLLLFDDIQFLENRRSFEEELAHTFEALKNKGAQVVITSDKPPSLLQLSARMISRMEGGIIAEMDIPNLETRVAILQYKAAQKGLDIPHEVAFFIAEHIYSNVRQLEGAVNRLSAHCRLLDLKVTEELVSRTLREMLQEAPRERISVEQILRSVASVFQVPLKLLKKPGRTSEIALPRQVAMYLAREMIKESLKMLGESFGKTHSTIIHACNTIEKKMVSDEELRNKIGLVRRDLGG